MEGHPFEIEVDILVGGPGRPGEGGTVWAYQGLIGPGSRVWWADRGSGLGRRVAAVEQPLEQWVHLGEVILRIVEVAWRGWAEVVSEIDGRHAPTSDSENRQDAGELATRNSIRLQIGMQNLPQWMEEVHRLLPVVIPSEVTTVCYQFHLRSGPTLSLSVQIPGTRCGR